MDKVLLLTFKSRIQTCYASLTRVEQRVADYMLQNPGEVMEATSAQIAESAGASPASVIRLCKSCGFSGLAELKMSIKREYYTMHTEKHSGDIQEDDPVALVKQKMVGYYLSVAGAILSTWNEAAYLHAVDELLSAKHILVTSFGGSKATAVCLTDFLLQLNLPCELWDDSAFVSMRIGSMGEGDVLFTINHSGRHSTLNQYAKLAKERGMTTIGITGVRKSPMTQHTDILLLAEMEYEYDTSTVEARIAELTVIEILYSLLAAKINRNAETFRKMNPLLEQWRHPPERAEPSAE